jgi:hypothetical protein
VRPTHLDQSPRPNANRSAVAPVSITKDNCDRALPGRPVYRVERMGALLSLVLDRRELAVERRTAKHASAASRLRSSHRLLMPLDPHPPP